MPRKIAENLKLNGVREINIGQAMKISIIWLIMFGGCYLYYFTIALIIRNDMIATAITLIASAISIILILNYFVTKFVVKNEKVIIKELKVKHYVTIVMFTIGSYMIIFAGFDNVISLIPSFYNSSLGQTYGYSYLKLSTYILPCLLAPLLEECIYRKIMLKGLAKKYGMYKALAITSFIFGLSHIKPQQIVYTTIFGFIFGLVYLMSGSLMIVILLHTVHNLYFLIGEVHYTLQSSHLLVNIVIALIGLFICVYSLVKYKSFDEKPNLTS